MRDSLRISRAIGSGSSIDDRNRTMASTSQTKLQASQMRPVVFCPVANQTKDATNDITAVSRFKRLNLI
jgi:hypothetical protein